MIVNPLPARRFGEGFGNLAKNARMLAVYGLFRDQRKTETASDKITEISDLVATRRQCVGQRDAERKLSGDVSVAARHFSRALIADLDWHVKDRAKRIAA